MCDFFVLKNSDFFHRWCESEHLHFFDLNLRNTDDEKNRHKNVTLMTEGIENENVKNDTYWFEFFYQQKFMDKTVSLIQSKIHVSISAFGQEKP